MLTFETCLFESHAILAKLEYKEKWDKDQDWLFKTKATLCGLGSQEREAEKEEVLDSILCCVEIECLESKFYVFFLISKEIYYSTTLQVTVYSQ